MGMAETLRKLDGHSSVSREFRVHTASGAFLSILTIAAIGYLSYTEFRFNFETTLIEKVYVNETSPRGLEIEFDLTIFSIPCAILSIDSNDPTGQRQSLHIDKEHHVWKHRMDQNGNFIGQRETIELGSSLLTPEEALDRMEDDDDDDDDDVIGGNATMEDEEEDDDDDDEIPCLSCYGAGDEGECCDTCDDVKRAYRRKGWILQDLDKIDQCRNLTTSAQEVNEGCNVHGRVALSTGGGNLHLAPNRDLENYDRKDLNIFDVFIQSFEQFNVSHRVNRLRFGSDYPGRISQLESQDRIIEDSYGMYQYYIQVVPTRYQYLNGTVIETNQYSVTEHMRHTPPGSGRGAPGVFVFYEVSPLHVKIDEYQRGWVSFFTSVAAIVGGVVTTMGMIDKLLYSSNSNRKTKELVR